MLFFFMLTACLNTSIQNTYNRSNLSNYPVAYREVLETWIGSPANDLLFRWGEPNKVFALPNGNQVYEYLADYVEFSASKHTQESSGYLSSSSICISRFEIKEFKVIRVDTWGDYCSKWREPKVKAEASHSQTTYID